MICQYCGKREATTHIKKIVNGRAEQVDLCPACASRLGYGSIFPGLGLSDFLGSFLGERGGDGRARRHCAVRSAVAALRISQRADWRDAHSAIKPSGTVWPRRSPGFTGKRITSARRRRPPAHVFGRAAGWTPSGRNSTAP